MRIARVFPRRTSMTPIDPDAWIGEPKDPLFCPRYDEAHISVAFTWDIPEAERIAAIWSHFAKNVRIGGPAISSPNGEFTPGMYVKTGVTFTSRGCPNRCPWCFVPDREGKLRTLQIKPGYIVQDNNLLACPKSHVAKVFEMLRSQRRGVKFSGGLDCCLLSDKIVEELRNLRIDEIWLSYDHPDLAKSFESAVYKLRRYFSQEKIRSYVLIGYKGDNLINAEERLRWAYEIGTLPVAMRFRTASENFKASFIYPERQWNLLTRKWSRPGRYRSRKIKS